LSSDSAPSDRNNGSGPDSTPATLQRFVVLGYILALAVPPLGFAIGIVLMLPRGVRSKHGVGIAAVSVLAAAVWVLLISSGALKDTGQGY